MVESEETNGGKREVAVGMGSLLGSGGVVSPPTGSGAKHVFNQQINSRN